MDSWTEDIKLSGPIPELDLQTGDSLQNALEAIAKEFGKINQLLEKELFPSSSTEITAANVKYVSEDPITGSLSGEALQYEGSLLKVEAVRQDHDVTLTFKAADFELPAGAKIASSTVNISGQRDSGRTEIANHTRNTEASMSIAYNRFPVTVDSRVVIMNAAGEEIELRKSVVVNSDKTYTQETPYEITDRTSQAKPTDLEGALKQFSARIKSLEKRATTNG